MEDVVREIQDVFGVSKNRAGVPQVVIWFSLICFGEKVGKNFQIQRSELKKSFRAFIGSEQEAFALNPEATLQKIHEFMCLLSFVGKWWELCYGAAQTSEDNRAVPIQNRFEGKWTFENGFLPEELQDKVDRSDIDVLNFCILFLIRAGQSLSIAILGRFYVQLLKDPSADNLLELVKAAKAVAAFTAVWLSGEKGSTQYAETQRRTMAHELDIRKNKQIPGKLAYFWRETGTSGESVSVEQMQRSFVSGYVDRNKEFSLGKWTEKLPDSELALMRKEVNRFLLLLYWQNSNSRKCYQSFGIRRYADKPEINFLTGERWNLLSQLEIEHIVPQEPKDWKLGFDPNSTQGKRILNEIGNTTLLPKRLNGFASNKPWEYKQRLYDSVCASNPEERAAIFDTLDTMSKKERKTIEDQLVKLEKDFRKVDTVLVDSVRHVSNWDDSVIRTRTRAIAHIVWPVLSNWLGQQAKFDKKSMEALFKIEGETETNVVKDEPQQQVPDKSLLPFFEIFPRSVWSEIQKSKLTIDNAGSYLCVRVEEGKMIVEMGRRAADPFLRARGERPESVELEKIPGEERGCEEKVLVYTGEGQEAEKYLVSLIKKKKAHFEER